MNEISRWVTNCFRKQIQNTMIPPFPLLKPAPTDLYTEIRGGYQNTNITNVKDFTDFTIYRGEIWENIEEIRRFTRISLIYTQISTKYMNHTMHIPVTKWHTYSEAMTIRDVNWQI